MPADHININHPDRRGVESDAYRWILENEKLKLELKQLRQWHEVVERDLSAIFNRIERGDKVELHYPDGRCFVVTGVDRASTDQ